jgi:hypothetical protein
MMSLRLFLIGTLAISLGLGCGEQHGPSMGLLGDPGNEELGPEGQARRSRMNIEVAIRQRATGYTYEKNVTARDIARELVTHDCFKSLKANISTNSALAAALGSSDCSATRMGTRGGSLNGEPVLNLPVSGATSACEVSLCRAQAAICVSNRLLEIASSVSSTPFVGWAEWDGALAEPGASEFDVAREVDLDLPPQDAETKVAMAEEAYWYASWAARVMGENLRYAVDSTRAVGFCSASVLNSSVYTTITPPGGAQYNVTFGESMASSLMDAALLVDEAARAAVQHHLAVSEADFSRIPDLSKATKLSWVGTDMSRARAAHLIAGGGLADGLPNTTAGIGGMEELSDRGRQALALLRYAGSHPARVTSDNWTFASLFQDEWGFNFSGNWVSLDRSIRQRLAERMGDPSFLNLSVTDFYKQRNLSETDFVEARAYLKQELTAFQRDSGVQVPPYPIPTPRQADGTATQNYTQYPYFATTANAPTPPPSGHYFSSMRLGKGTLSQAEVDDGMPNTTSGVMLPSPTYARRGAAQLLDYATAVAGELSVTSANGSPLKPTILDILATTAGGLGRKGEGRIESCYRNYTTTGSDLRLRAYGYTGAADFIVVRQLSGLRCATEGAVEGAPCDLSKHVVLLASAAEGTVTSGPADLRSYVELKITSPSPYTPYYLVRRKATQPPIPAGTYVPGGYESMGLVRTVDLPAATGTTGAYAYCTLVPVNRDLEGLVAETLTPSMESLAHAEKTCAGPGYSERIPLESELSSNGDSYENSWMVYLERAKEAAGRADALGEELLDRGLAIDQRIEDAVTELEDICGGAVNASDFFPSTMTVRGGSCTADATCSAGMVCRNNVCVKDALATIESRTSDPSAKKLAECLGNAGSIDYAALGSRAVCIWVNPTTGRMCEPIEGVTQVCPRPSDDIGACTDFEDLVPVAWRKTVSVHLDQFAVPPIKRADPETPPCEHLRKLRTGADPAQSVAELIPFFSSPEFDEYVEQIGWEAMIDDYSKVTVDGDSVWRTGTPIVATLNPAIEAFQSAEWPCTKVQDPNELPWTYQPCAPGQELRSTLFGSCTSECSPDSTNRNARVLMNHRLGRAVLALRILKGIGLGQQFVGPYFPDRWQMLDATNPSEDGTEFDYHAWKLKWDSTSSVKGQLWGGRSVTEAVSGLRYAVEEDDWGDDDWDEYGEFPITGQRLCIGHATNNIVWTDVPFGLAQGVMNGNRIAANHPESQFRSTCGDTANLYPLGGCVTIDNKQVCQNFTGSEWPMVFKTHGADKGPDPSTYANNAWAGLNGSALPEGARAPLEGLIAELLTLPPRNPEKIVLARGSHEANALTTYWKIFDEDDKSDDNNQFNEIAIARDGLRARDVLDALELVCEVARRDPGRAPKCSDRTFTPPESLSDLGKAEADLRCIRNEMRTRIDSEVLTDVPKAAVEGLNASYQFEGARGAAAGRFGTAIRDIGATEQRIEAVLLDFASEIHKLRWAIRRGAISKELADIEFMKTAFNQGAACANSVFDCFGVDSAWKSGKGFQAAVTCANSLAQIGYANEQKGLTQESTTLSGKELWEEFRQKFQGYAQALANDAKELEKHTTLLRATLAELRTQREQGRRALSKAMMMGTDAAGRQFAVNTVMRRRYNTLQVRYQRALEVAKRSAWIARRAVEQRLGFQLSEMRQDLILVDSPARWADEVCTLDGIDYARIRKERGLATDEFSSAYIGDYVRKLELVAQSYEHDFPFHDAQDTAVVSLRDDVVKSLSLCESAVPNLLAYSSILSTVQDPEDTGVRVTLVPDRPDQPAVQQDAPKPVATIWKPVGCKLVNGEIANCVLMSRLGNAVADRPIARPDLGMGEVPGHRATFALGWNGATDPSLSTTSFTRSTAVVQSVDLTPGWHRVSWYGRGVDVDPTAGEQILLDPKSAVQVRPPSGTLDATAPRSITVPGDWTRYYFLFFVPQAGTYQVALVPSSTATSEHSVDLAAVMLEDVGDRIPEATVATEINLALNAPGMYVATAQAGSGVGPACEDTTGKVFRTFWRRGCQKLCPVSFASCDDAEIACYWELSFDVPLAGIEHGDALAKAGFAHGNYNHRIDGVAVNFVGSGLQDCSKSAFPSACYGSGNLQYSIEHLGPYQVRNHIGDIYEAPLFTGRIEHGRGLAAERYVTNPLSSADRGLVDPYTHYELRGRPLTGGYVLRVWDVDGLNFAALEDVQVVLGYRYWTPFK